MDFKKKQKFSIRKLTLGTVSVFLGATLVLGNNVVEANGLEITEQKVEQKSEEKVKIGYLGVDEKDLNDIEKKLIEKKDIREEVAKGNDTYVVVYRGKEDVKNVLPKTGLSGDILNLLIVAGLILCIYRLGKKKATLIGIVIVTTISGVTSLKTIKAEEVLKEIFKNTIVYKENSNLEKLDLDNFEYLGYIKDENIPTNTRLYKLVEEYKKNNLLEKEEEKSSEKVEKPKETESVEEVKQDPTVSEKPKEEANPTEEEKPGEGTNPAEEVEPAKETPNVEEGNSDSTVEEKPKEEVNPTEEVEKPQETPNVEEGNSNSTVEETPKEETNPTEEVEAPKETPKETPNLEEGKSDSTVEEKPKEEVNPTEEEKPGEGTNPAEEVEHPKETPSVEEGKSDSTVEEKPSEETKPTEKVEKPKETESVEEGKSDSNAEESKEETKPTEEAEQPKEETKPAEEVEQPKEETKPAEEVEKPRETPSTEEMSEPNVEEKGLSEARLSLENLKSKVKEVEDKKTEISNDKLINPTEKAELDKLIEEARTLKSEVTDLVNSLKDSDKKDELSKELSLLAIPNTVEINDKNANGKIDTAGNVEQAKAKIEEVKAKVKEAEDKKVEISNNKLITPTEKTELDKLIDVTTKLKEKAKELVTSLEDSDKKDELSKELSLLAIPNTVEINDKNANGKIDTAGNVEQAKAKIEEVKAKVKEAEDKKVEISNNKLITPTEKTELDKLIKEATILKSEATTLVNNLADSDKKDELSKELSSLVIPNAVEINDNNSNGKIDTVGNVEQVKAKIEEVKEKVKEVEAKKIEISNDKLINPTEKTELDKLIEEARTLKSEATDLVNSLKDSDKKDELSKELTLIHIISTLEVNDKNANGKIDTAGNVEEVKVKIEEVKAKVREAESKKAEISNNKLITPTEKTELDKLIKEATTLKSEATTLVNNLADSDKKVELSNELSSIQIPNTVEINDKNANGKIDTVGNVEQAKVKIEEVKAKVKEAEDKKAEISRDETVTSEEKQDLDNLIKEANISKEEVKSIINSLSDSDRKDDLLVSISQISIPESLDVTKAEVINEELKETKIEFKNVEHAYLYRLNSNNEFEKVLSIYTVDKDLSKYKVKAFLKDANKNIWLDVKSINLLDNKYKIDTSFDNLVSIDNNLKVTDTYSIEVAKRNEKSSDNEYNSFSDMINKMKLVADSNKIIKGDYILSDNVSASEVSISDSETSYLDNYTFVGNLKSKDGNVFSITDLKKPLFNNVVNSKISNLNLKDVDISVFQTGSVGSLSNNTTNSIISNIKVNGKIAGKESVGGIIGVLDNESILENVAYTGIISSLEFAGGLTADVTRGSIIRNSYADVNITTSHASEKVIGGLSAHVNQNGSIENSYVKGEIVNNGDKDLRVGGVVGAVYGSGNDKGKIKNVVSFVKVTNGKDFIGNLEELKVSKYKLVSNNYIVINGDIDKYNKNTSYFEYIDKSTAENKINEIKEINNEENTIINNYSKVIYSNLKEYKHTHDKAYENISKLLPFYDRYTIVREANKLLENDNLNTKTIKYIKAFVGDKLVKDLYSEKNNVNKITVYYTDGSKDSMNITLRGEFKDSGILDYVIKDKNILYTPNRLAKNNSSLVNNLATEFSEATFDYNLFNPYNLIGLDDSVKNRKLGRLYLEDNFNKIKNSISEELLYLISNYDIADYTKDGLKEYVGSKIRNNKNNILVGLNYLDRWYDFSEAKNNLLYSLESYGVKSNSLDLVIDVGSQTVDMLEASITDSLYEQVISKYTGNNNFIEFISDIYNDNKDREDQSIDEWIKKVTSAYLIITTSKDRPSANETIFERLSRPSHRSWILPILTIKNENVYGFFTTNSSNMGIFDSYISVSKNNSDYNLELSKFKNKVDHTAKAMQSFFDTWYRILDEKSVEKLINTKIQVFDSFRDLRTRKWSKEYGLGALDSVKSFVGPIKAWKETLNNSGAYAVNNKSIDRVYFTGVNLLEEMGISVLTHEHVHNLDRKVLFGGYGRRLGHGPENFAMGLLQTPTVSSPIFGINLAYEVSNNDRYLLTHNSTPERFQKESDLQEYMKGVFDVLYTLDLAEAEVILEEGTDFINKNYKKLKSEKGYYVNPDIIEPIYNSNFKLHSLNDLIDANIIGSEQYSTSYGRNSYVEVNMFNANYGINENPNGSSGGFTFRRVAFELLAEKGYYDGMIPYLSNKYYIMAEDNEKENASSDNYVLNKIFNGHYSSYKEFRKDMFAKRDLRKNDLKPVTVWGIKGNNKVTINSYNDLKNLIKQAIKTNNKNTLLTLKQNIYHEYLILTNEFRESIYKSK